MKSKIDFKRKIFFKDLTFYEFNKNKSFQDLRGLILFPSGPGLSSILGDLEYYNSLKKADINFLDSGLFCLLLSIRCMKWIRKCSAYEFYQIFLKHLATINKKIFLVEPNHEVEKLNKDFLLGINKSLIISQYVAPDYSSDCITDSLLLRKIKINKPEIIILNIAGGRQEKLGLYIKNNYMNNHKLTILCTGAALSFFTGYQARINSFYDRLYLGWLVRCMNKPKIFIPRYFKSISLVSSLGVNFIARNR